MPPQPMSRKWTAAFVAVSLLGSSTAHAAVSTARIDPLVAVSVFGTSESRTAVCAAGAQAAAQAGAAMAAQAGTTGCVLPAVDALPPPPVAENIPPPVAAAPVAASNFPVLPLLLGLAALVGFAALVLHDDEENGEIVLPISP